MQAAEKALIEALLETIKVVGSTLGTLLMLVLLWFRSRDKKAADDQLSRLEGKLEVLTRGFDENITKSQAFKVIDAVYGNMASVLHCWFCGYVRAGKPEMTVGEWNLELVIKSQRLLTKERLGVFMYAGHSLGEYVMEDSFKKLCTELKKGVQTFSDTEGISKYIANRLDELKMEVKDNLL